MLAKKSSAEGYARVEEYFVYTSGSNIHLRIANRSATWKRGSKERVSRLSCTQDEVESERLSCSAHPSALETLRVDLRQPQTEAATLWTSADC